MFGKGPLKPSALLWAPCAWRSLGDFRNDLCAFPGPGHPESHLPEQWSSAGDSWSAWGPKGGPLPSAKPPGPREPACGAGSRSRDGAFRQRRAGLLRQTCPSLADGWEAWRARAGLFGHVTQCIPLCSSGAPPPVLRAAQRRQMTRPRSHRAPGMELASGSHPTMSQRLRNLTSAPLRP